MAMPSKLDSLVGNRSSDHVAVENIDQLPLAIEVEITFESNVLLLQAATQRKAYHFIFRDSCSRFV